MILDTRYNECTDRDADIDTGTDADPGAQTDTDVYVDADTDEQTDAETDADTGPDMRLNAETHAPCQVLDTRYGYSGITGCL